MLVRVRLHTATGIAIVLTTIAPVVVLVVDYLQHSKPNITALS